MADKRPTTCHEIAKLDPTLGELNCKRLPRHGGEHRPFRTARQARQAAAAPKVAPKGQKAKGRKVTIAERRQIVAVLRTEAGAKARGRVTAKQRRDMMAALAAKVGSGLSANDALGIAALF